MTITYFLAVRCVSVDADEQITTLATGDDDADVERLSEHARSLGWPLFSIRKMVSDASGDGAVSGRRRTSTATTAVGWLGLPPYMID